MDFKLNFTSMSSLVFAYLTIRGVIDGLEELLIQPTAWYYMKILGESNMFLGLTLASFSVGSLVFGPFIGILEVKFGVSTKAILIMSGLIKLFGSLLYSIPVNGYFPLFGRFLSGIGEGAVGVMFGVVTKCTTDENRAKAFLFFDSFYSFGLILGPTVGSLLTFKVDILGWKINAGNSAAVILAIIWILLLSFTMFLPRDLAENSKKEVPESDEDIADLEETALSESVAKGNIASHVFQSNVMCLYYLTFLMKFTYSLVVLYVPLLAGHHLGLALVHVKLIFLNGSLFDFIFYAIIFLFVERMSVKNFLALGIASLIIPISIILYFAISWYSAISVNATYLLVVLICIVTAQSANFLLTGSMLSKLTPVESGSFYQSLSFTVSHIAIMAGRSIAGATFAKIPMMGTCCGLSMCWLFGMIWLGIEFKSYQ